MWCRCSGGGGGGRNVGYTRQEDSDLWVHSGCLQPTRMVFEKVTDMLVPNKATALLRLNGRADGIQELTFDTQEGKKVCLVYHPYPRKVGMEQGRELLLGVWRKLDAATERVMNRPEVGKDDTSDWMNAKVEARAYANVLADFMQPFFNNPDDIVREAVKRYKARQAGTEYETPGLAEHIWDPTKNWDGSDRIQFNTGGTKAQPKSAFKPPAKLTEEQAAFCRKALADKVMDAEALAGMFKVPVSAIKELG